MLVGAEPSVRKSTEAVGLTLVVEVRPSASIETWSKEIFTPIRKVAVEPQLDQADQD